MDDPGAEQVHHQAHGRQYDPADEDRSRHRAGIGSGLRADRAGHTDERR